MEEDTKRGDYPCASCGAPICEPGLCEICVDQHPETSAAESGAALKAKTKVTDPYLPVGVSGHKGWAQLILGLIFIAFLFGSVIWRVVTSLVKLSKPIQPKLTSVRLPGGRFKISCHLPDGSIRERIVLAFHNPNST